MMPLPLEPVCDAPSGDCGDDAWRSRDDPRARLAQHASPRRARRVRRISHAVADGARRVEAVVGHAGVATPAAARTPAGADRVRVRVAKGPIAGGVAAEDARVFVGGGGGREVDARLGVVVGAR